MMKFDFAGNGTLTMTAGGKTVVSPSPVGLLTVGGQLLAPMGAKETGDDLILSYGAYTVTLTRSYRKNGSLKLTLASFPAGADAFIFGGYACPEAVRFGDMVGAAWAGDGSAVCIQSLNPKTMGEKTFPYTNGTSFPTPTKKVAGKVGDTVLLSCAAVDLTRVHVPLPDGSPVGAAIVLTWAKDAASLLDDIGEMELEEGMPHPMIDGTWAKKSPLASDIYFVFDDGDTAMQLRTSEKADVHGIYFGDPFTSWGHFEINRNLYPNGEKDFAAAIEEAKRHGVNVGFHTLSNFIHTNDPYVTPVPHKDLLDHDPTPLARSIGETDTDVFIGEALGYASRGNLGCIRIGDELIQYAAFDAAEKRLSGCTRGAFGTRRSAHEAGETVTHLKDHGYMTLFPSITLQREMADRIGTLIRTCKVRRVSFDGLEGCFATDAGEYAPSEYVRRVYEIAGNDFICDASISSHYRWHTHSYFNWGEPWYDSDLRGGLYNTRASHQDYFRDNLLPGMLGWYVIGGRVGICEPTLPETLEFILSRMIAFDAGLCICVKVPESEKLDRDLAVIRLWQAFRREVRVPRELAKHMQARRSDWHLERGKDGKGWILSELDITEVAMSRCDQSLLMESGTTGYVNNGRADLVGGKRHNTNIIMDMSTPGGDVPPVDEPLHCRIRVGDVRDKGVVQNLVFSTGWFGGTELLRFAVTADAGDYLEYEGGLTLRRYDADYHYLETVTGVGHEIALSGASLSAVCVGWDQYLDDEMELTFRQIRKKQEFYF